MNDLPWHRIYFLSLFLVFWVCISLQGNPILYLINMICTIMNHSIGFLEAYASDQIQTLMTKVDRSY